MKKFDKIYKNQAEKAKNIKETKVENDFRKIYECLLTECEISSIEKLSNDEKKSFNATLNKLWNKEVGLTTEGEKFISEKYMFLTEASTVNQRKNYLKKKLGDNIKYVIESSMLKENLYNHIDECIKQINVHSLNEMMSYEDLEEVITTQVNKYVKSYFEPVLEELKETYKK